MKEPEIRPSLRQKSQRATAAAARTYLKAQMGWLQGVPLELTATGVLWATLPRPGSRARSEILTVDAERLRRTEFGRNAARRKFPKALAGVVGDVTAWSERTDAQLSMLKRSVHEGAALPDLPQLMDAAKLRRSTVKALTALVRNTPALTQLLAGLIWLHWDDEEQLIIALGAIDTPALALVLDRCSGRDGLIAAHRLVQLAVDGAPPALLQLIGDRRLWDVACASSAYVWGIAGALKLMRTDNVRDAKFMAAGAPRPASELGGQLVTFALALAGRDPEVCARQLRLLEILWPPEMLLEWETWWTKADNFEREVRRFLAICDAVPDSADQWRCEALETRLQEELAPPGNFDWPALKALIERGSAATPAVFNELTRCLELLSRHDGAEVLMRQFLEGWSPEFVRVRRGWGVINQVLAAQRRVTGIPRPSDTAQIAWVTSWLSAEIVSTWIDDGKPQKLIRPMFAVIEQLISDGNLWQETSCPLRDHRSWTCLLTALEDTGDANVVARAFKAAPPVNGGLSGPLWNAVLRLAGYEVDKLVRFAGRWQAEHWDEDLAPELVRLSTDPALASILADGIGHGEGLHAARLVALSRLSQTLAMPVHLEPLVAARSLNTAAYPVELRPVLDALTRWDANAGQAVEQILGDDFPSTERAASEIETLRRLAAEAASDRRLTFDKRIAALQRRLATPAKLSARRLGNHLAKLERRLAHARLQRWEDALIEALQLGLAAELDVAPPAEWLARPEVMQVLAGLAGLQPHFRALAFRLLALSLGPPPWDMRTAPQNDAFVETIEQLGIKTEPWLDGIGPLAITVGGRPLEIDLEGDPLEIMRMGAPFETCLAPNGFNFFSTVTNAADINKRVLYARDAFGTIQARCLLALTDDGHIVTFHIYAHARAEEVIGGIRTYVENLARAMGTSVAPRGEIRKLVATNWYDDGPHDLTGQLAFLEDGSEFLSAVSSMSVSELVPRLQEALGGTPITPSIVCMLARRDCVQKRPALVLPLLPHLGDFVRLDRWTRVLLVPLVRAAGDTETAQVLLEPLLHPSEVRTYHEHWPTEEIAEELMALGQPHRALRLIQQTKPDWVEDWPGEVFSRTFIAARALWALRRPSQALELARIAQKSGATEAGKLIAEIEGAQFR